jgi:hypothetical protein
MSNLNIIKSYPTLVLSVGFSSLALFPDVPIWTFIVAIFFWGWKALTALLSLKNPSKYITGFFSFIFFVLIYLEFKTYLGKESATSYIIILTSLKILEFTDEKEKDFIILLGFFLITAKFLFSYDLIYLLFSIPTYILLTLNLLPASWLKENLSTAIKYLSKIFVLAIPMSLVMFFLFPRITKTLTELNINSKEGVSGFSDSISPGSISQLSLSNEVAMRLEIYHTNGINIKNLYIKGLVLEKNQKNMDWTTIRSSSFLKQTTTPDEIDYKLVIEPTNKLHLFSLVNTTSLFSDTHRIFSDQNNIYRTDAVVEKRISLKGTTGIVNLIANEQSIQQNSELPKTSTDVSMIGKLKSLIVGFKNNSSKPSDINNKILTFFKSENFQYSLTPGQQAELSLETFIFKTKRGYCEHFAAAHASLLRLSGVPARVVVGYQGGEFNSLGDFWTIRQKDAHAWVEYLNENARWVLTDPVSIVAPQRIELGGQLFSSVVSDLLTVQEIENRIKSKDILNQAIMWFENINYQWTSFLLDYDFDKQKELFKKIRLNSATALIGLILLFLSLSLFIQKLLKTNVEKNYSTLAFEKINDWALDYNLFKLDSEGPIQWRERIKNNLKNKNSISEINEVFDLWISISFKENSSTNDYKTKYRELLIKMKQLKVKQ